MAEERLAIAIEAVNNASAALNAVKADLQGIGAQAQATQGGMAGFSNSLGGLSTQAAKLGGVMTLGLTAPIVALGKAAFDVTREFEQRLANAFSVMGDVADADKKKLSGLAEQLGRDTAFKASEAADAMYSLASAGLKTDQIMGALPKTLDLAAATQTDLSKASEQTAVAMTVFGIKANEVGRITDSFVAGITNTPLTFQRITESMKFAGPAMANFGKSVEETVAALGLFAQSGIFGARAGTALRGILTSLANPTKEMVGVFKSLGISMNELNPKTHSLGQVFDRLQESGASTEQIYKAFGKVLGSTVVAALKQANDSGRKVSDVLNELQSKMGETGAASEVAQKQLDTVDGALKVLGSSIQDVAIQFNKDLFQGGDTFKGLILDINKVINSIATLDPSIKQAIVAFGAFLAIIGPIALVIAAVSGAMAVLLTPLGLTVIAIAAAGVAAVVFKDQLGKLETAFKPLEEAAKKVYDALNKAFQSIDWNAVIGFIVDLLAGFVEGVTEVGKGFIFVGKIILKFVGDILGVLDKLAKAFGLNFGDIGKTLSKSGETIGKVIGVVLGLVAAFLAVSTIASVVGAAIALLASPFTILIGVIALAVYAYTTNLGGFKDFVDNLVIDIRVKLQDIGNGFSVLSAAVAFAFEAIALAVLANVKLMFSVLSLLPGEAGKYFKGMADQADSAMKGLVKDMDSNMKTMSEGTVKHFEIMKAGAEDKLALLKDSADKLTGEAKTQALQHWREMVEAAQKDFPDMRIGSTQELEQMREAGVNSMLELRNGALEITGAIKTGVTENMSGMKDDTLELTGALKTGVVDNITELQTQSTEAVSKMSTDTLQLTGALKTGVVEDVTTMQTQSTGAISNMAKDSITLTGAMKTSAIDNASKMQSGVSTAASGMSKDAGTSAGTLKTNVETATTGMKISAITQASLMKTGVVNEAGQTSKGVSDKLSGISNDSGSWGLHLVQNFAGGIRAGIGAVTGAVAQIIAQISKVKFSTNKDLPTEIWGQHSVENFASGMKVATPKVAGQVDNLKDSIRSLSDIKISVGDLAQFEGAAKKEKEPVLTKNQKKNQEELKKSIEETSKELEKLGVFVVKQNGQVVDSYNSIEDGIKKYKDRLLDLDKTHETFQNDINKIGDSIKNSLNPQANLGKEVITTYDQLKTTLKEIQKAVDDANSSFKKFTDGIQSDSDKSAKKIEDINNKYNSLVTDIVQKTSASIASAYTKELEKQEDQIDKLAAAKEKQSDAEYKLKQITDDLAQTQLDANDALSKGDNEKYFDLQKKIEDKNHQLQEAQEAIAAAQKNVTDVEATQKATADSIKQFNDLRVNAQDFSKELTKASEESKKLADDLEKLKTDKASTSSIIDAQEKYNAAKEKELILLGKQNLTIEGRKEFENKLAEEEAKRNLSEIDFLLFKAGKEIELAEENKNKQIKIEEDLQKVRKQILSEDFNKSVTIDNKGNVDFTQANAFLDKLKESGASQEAQDLAQKAIQELAQKKVTLEQQRILLEEAKATEIQIYTDTRVELENQQKFLEATLTQSYDNIILKLRELQRAAEAALAAARSAGVSGGSFNPGLPGHEEGGFTAAGPKHEVAGVVHKGEWVAPQWMVGKFGNIFGVLEGIRQNKYADGGFVQQPGATYNQPITMNNTISDQADFNSMAEFLAWKLRTT